MAYCESNGHVIDDVTWPAVISVMLLFILTFISTGKMNIVVVVCCYKRRLLEMTVGREFPPLSFPFSSPFLSSLPVPSPSPHVFLSFPCHLFLLCPSPLVSLPPPPSLVPTITP